MPVETGLFWWIAAWIIIGTFVVIRHWRDHQGTGLVATYVLSFAALHWLSPALSLLPWHDAVDPLSASGLRISVWGILGFAIGGEYAMRRHVKRKGNEAGTSRALLVEPRLVNVYLFIGVVVYGVIFPFAAQIPSATAIVATASTLAVAAIGLKCWNAWQRSHWALMAGWLISTLALPFITVIGQGFLGYGFAAMLTIFAFVAAFQRLRWFTVVASVILAYVGMSFYVTYMRDRSDIRDIVWSGGEISDRLAQVQTTIGSAEWFDPSNVEHLERVDSRLNQNYLVGAAVHYLEAGKVDYAHGATLWDAVLSMIPRAMWPGKPVFAGSGDLVANFTGFRYAAGTSVGIGAVMECYVNFGTAGVIVGFFLLGAAIVYVDRSAGSALRVGDADTFLKWYLPGLSLMNIGGLFAEITGTGAAALVVVMIVSQVTERMKRKREDELQVLKATQPGVMS